MKLMNYYNEHDPAAAAWLRELVRSGQIPQGEVDERDIQDIHPNELRRFTQCHFFAGIGGWPLALRLAGWPEGRPVWTGSCPCQPFSAAGKGDGFADERHLWPAFHHLIKECRPPVVFGEQVASKDGLHWLDLVRADLEGSGYAFGASDLCAAGIGAPHIRQRLYFVGMGDAVSPGLEGHAGNVHHGHGSGREDAGQGGPASQAGADGGMADANRWECDRIPDGEGCQPNRTPSGREQGHGEPQCGGGVGGMADATIIGRREECPDGGGIAFRDSAQGIPAGSCPGSRDHRPSPLDSLWSSPDWLLCRDGKWRPVIASHVGVDDGLPYDMVRSRDGCVFGYSTSDKEEINGKTPKADTTENMQVVLENHDSQSIQRTPRGPELVPEEDALRQGVHGHVDDKGALCEPKSQSSEGPQSNQTGVRKLQSERISSRTSQRFGPFEQRPIKLDDVVSKLPQEISLAELHGRWKDAKAMRLLCETICKIGSVQFSPFKAVEIWKSISSQDKDRIRMGVGYNWVARSFSPLSRSEPARVMRLRGYGNAIVPQLAAEFIKAIQ